MVPSALKPITLDRVDITGGFWYQKQQINYEFSIPSILEQLKKTGRIDCFDPEYKGYRHIFYDSDTAKWLEAACYALKKREHPSMNKEVEEIIEMIIKAQQPDGYLNSYYTYEEPENRWKNLRDRHELYCAGHLMEAAVAHYELTGKKKFLDTLSKYANYIDSIFGKSEGKIPGYPGHEEIELALIRLYGATKNKKYKDLARYFVEERGNLETGYYFVKEAIARGENPGDLFTIMEKMKYWQSHAPIREQKEAVGHAVRAGYLYSGVADIANQFEDEPLLNTCIQLWEDIYYRKMYITGGVGARYAGEAFGDPYELDNLKAYAETCAALAFAFFSQRMLQITGESKYADAVERLMYNGSISGVSLDGKKFFYINPLAYKKGYRPSNLRCQNQRPDWFGCSCCPPNIARFLASIGTYFYSESNGGKPCINIHQYSESTAMLFINKIRVGVTQQTNYPWNGLVNIQINPNTSTEFGINLRIPAWCNDFSVNVNGEVIGVPIESGYLSINRMWKPGDLVTLEMEMPIERIYSNPQVKGNIGRVALQRGPIVYCLESVDNPVDDLDSIILPKTAPLVSKFEPDVLDGVMTIQADAIQLKNADWGDKLYGSRAPSQAPIRIKAIPYFAWANREPGEMLVWILEQ